MQWGTDEATMLAVAASRASDVTLVLIVDTTFGRASRVHRDDGPQLGQLANAAQTTGAFVSLALDDDIAGADGANVALAGTYRIDYLDPEHLYRVADLYVLRKNAQSRAALHDIYLSLRANVPGFNWSEPRFAALYPVHPLVADVASAVRLYAPAFAFLPFAAAAAAHATSRPALSLILLDEVFDRAEQDLRHSTDLSDAFAVYDDLAMRGVAQFPVMQRLQARLVLKSLFILSLDGHGATASELCAALLMSDESSPAQSVARMDEILTRFAGDGAAAATAGALHRSVEGATGGETRYRIEISASAKFDAALEASVERTPFDRAAAAKHLRALARQRFEDWPLGTDEQGESPQGVNFQVVWRGAERPGRLSWQGVGEAMQAFEPPAPAAAAQTAPHYDWQVFVLAPEANGETSNAGAQAQPNIREAGGVPITIFWQPAELSPEELTIFRRLHALRSDAELLNIFGETARAATSILAAQAERIWTRLYMNDSVLVIDGTRRAFTDRARAAQTIGDALSQILALHFGERYAKHPLFVETLGEAEVERLIEGLFGSTVSDEAEVQHLARVFAQPLGLAVIRGSGYVPEMGDGALEYAWVRDVLALVDAANGEVVPLDALARALRRPPYGLLRDAQHLVLAALVAQRRIELVTPEGDRVSRRTLGRAIKWEEVAGVARTAVIHHDAEELAAWARLLTNNGTLSSITDPEGRGAVRIALSAWLDSWRELRLLENLNALPDAGLTTRVWKTGIAIRKSFVAAAEAIEATLATDISLEESLQRIADAFAGSTENFARLSRQLEELSGFVSGIEEGARARAYLAAAEATGVDEIESARRELLAITDDPHNLLDAERRARLRLLWREFHTRYTEHYASLHERTVGASLERLALDELLASERWREFELLSQLPFVNRQIRNETDALLRRATLARCDLPVRQLLDGHPSCACAFRLSRAAAFTRLSQDLEELLELGLAAYRRTLSLFSVQLSRALDALSAGENGASHIKVESARRLSESFGSQQLQARFTRTDIRLIERAVNAMDAPPPVRVHLPTEGCGLLTREELSVRLRQWLDDLPAHTALIELAPLESETDAT